MIRKKLRNVFHVIVTVKEESKMEVEWFSVSFINIFSLLDKMCHVSI